MLVFKRVDKDYASIGQIAVWHNETPRIWNPGHISSQADIIRTIDRIKDTPDNDLYLAVAEDCGNAPQAFIWAYRMQDKPDKAMILSLFTAPSYRGKGVARTLKLLCEEWCRVEGINQVQTTVHYKNEAMIALNLKMGYEAGMLSMSKIIER